MPPASAALRYRVRGPLSESAVTAAPVGTSFVRTAFDQRSRATLDVVPAGFVVRHEGFKKGAWAWVETAEARRTYDGEESDLACRYFNALLLSPGYLGPVRVDLEQNGE